MREGEGHATSLNIFKSSWLLWQSYCVYPGVKQVSKTTLAQVVRLQDENNLNS